MPQLVNDIDAGIPLTELVSNVRVVKPVQVLVPNVDVNQLIFVMKQKLMIAIQKLRVKTIPEH